MKTVKMNTEPYTKNERNHSAEEDNSSPITTSTNIKQQNSSPRIGISCSL